MVVAISCGDAIRPSGAFAPEASISDSVMPKRGWAVSVKPGATALVRMPCELNAEARERVNPMTPAFVDA